MISYYLRHFLRESTAIRDRVDGRIFPEVAPQGTQGELIILTNIGENHNYSLTAETATRQSTVQIACYAATPRSAYSLAELVRNRLSGYRGAMGESSDTTIYGATISGVRGAYAEEPEDASDVWVHSYTRDYDLTWTTTTPTLT